MLYMIKNNLCFKLLALFVFLTGCSGMNVSLKKSELANSLKTTKNGYIFISANTTHEYALAPVGIGILTTSGWYALRLDNKDQKKVFLFSAPAGEYRLYKITYGTYDRMLDNVNREFYKETDLKFKVQPNKLTYLGFLKINYKEKFIGKDQVSSQMLFDLKNDRKLLLEKYSELKNMPVIIPGKK